ncbi:hypothetical protein EVAR_49275_1 [Eumeta japonica]|uniref:Uncharacterized protein n=1 Tax=Eumeta variegata TaxID=151549 RepID=A0A4C1YIK4_EUMVA|nr:hypothetical protein EVAR_49275_1 [Eumeta japonica]
MSVGKHRTARTQRAQQTPLAIQTTRTTSEVYGHKFDRSAHCGRNGKIIGKNDKMALAPGVISKEDNLKQCIEN